MPSPSPLLRRPDYTAAEYTLVTPANAGWEHLHFAARRLNAGQRWEHATGDNELALVILSGVASVRSNRGTWTEIGQRASVFDGFPYTLYLPRGTQFTLEAHTDGFDVAYGWCASGEEHPVALVTPEQVTTEIRGGANASRQISGLLNPGFNCQRLVAVEVYTPSGNWSSYPPHKHDVHRTASDGSVLEADLEEIYFYKIARAGSAAPGPDGYALQRVYTADGHLDETLLAHTDDTVLVPEGYHPVVAAHGYHTYYLNFLAGSAQSLANSDDPAYAWIKDTWREKDPRLPLVAPRPHA
jgi:5-deoxy-glucuronate isomerase